MLKRRKFFTILKESKIFYIRRKSCPFILFCFIVLKIFIKCDIREKLKLKKIQGISELVEKVKIEYKKKSQKKNYLIRVNNYNPPIRTSSLSTLLSRSRSLQ